MQSCWSFRVSCLPVAHISGACVTWFSCSSLFHIHLSRQVTLADAGMLTQSCLTLCHPMDCSPPGSSVHGILQARMLERVVMSSSRGPFRPRGQTPVFCIAGGFFAAEPPGEPDARRDPTNGRACYTLGNGRSCLLAGWLGSSFPSCLQVFSKDRNTMGLSPASESLRT